MELLMDLASTDDMSVRDGAKHALTYYPHYCYSCQNYYYGTVLGKIRNCPRCSSSHVSVRFDLRAATPSAHKASSDVASGGAPLFREEK